MNPSTGHLDAPPNRIRDALVDFVIRRSAIAFLLGLGLIFGLAYGGQRITANFTHTAFFKSDDPLLAEFNRFERQYGNDDALVLVVHSPSGIFDLPSATLIQELTEKMWLIPDVIRVDSLANFSWVHSVEDDIEVEPLLPDDEPLDADILAERERIAMAHETIPDYLISRDGKTAIIYARIRPGFESPPDSATIVGATRKLLGEVAKGDHSFYLTGGPAINFAFQDSSKKDSSTLVPVVLLMAIACLVLMLRTIGGVIMPLVVIATSVVASFGIAGWLGIELSSVTIVLPQVLIAVAIADSVHILSSFYRARRRGIDKIAAARYTLAKNFVPTILTSVSTAAGFFSFATSSLKPVLGLGLLAGFGTVIAWFASYLIMGPLMVWSPSWVRSVGEAHELKRASERALRYTRFVHRHRWGIIGAYAVISVGALAIASSNRVNSDPYKYFSEDYPVRKAQDFIIDNLSGIAGFEMSIAAGREDGIKEPAFLKKVEDFETKVVALPGITKAISLVDIFKQTNRSLHGDDPAAYALPATKDLVAQEFLLYTMSLPQGMDVNDRVTVKNDALRMTLISRITDSDTWTRTAAKIQLIGADLGLDVTVSGKTMLYQSMNGYVTRSFIQSLLIAAVLVSLILIVAFRSLPLGSLAMLPNIVPLMIGGAVLKLIGHDLDIGTVLVCSVCLGIAVDDTIHILTNFRRHQHNGLDAIEAIAMTLTHTGPALVVTTMVLVAAFGTLAFATFIPNVFFGIMTAVILSAALLADLTFLPAILMARAARHEARLPTATLVESAS